MYRGEIVSQVKVHPEWDRGYFAGHSDATNWFKDRIAELKAEARILCGHPNGTMSYDEFVELTEKVFGSVVMPRLHRKRMPWYIRWFGI
jgi:hypothetical protein